MALKIKPLIRQLELGALTFHHLVNYFSTKPYFVFLDNRSQETLPQTFSFIAFDPFLIFASKADRVGIRERGNGNLHLETGKNTFHRLDELLNQYRMEEQPEIAPFLGGAIGYFGYELGRQIESLPQTAEDVMNIPECYLCFYNTVIIYNHEQQQVYLSWFDPGIDAPVTSMQQVMEEIASIPPDCGTVDLAIDTAAAGTLETGGLTPDLIKRDFTPRQYMDAVNRIKTYILAGDVYQVDLTQRFETDVAHLDPWHLYKCLMHINPSPYASYLNFSTDPGLGDGCNGVTVVSSSPESFLRVRGRHVETRPIKGTVKRGRSRQEDDAHKTFLLNDEKNRAELAMIVDLLRNDIGRVCEPGSVKVDAFPQLETYSSVHHLAATISGRLSKGKTIIDLLRATFPGGSITGVPKIRAMEILDQLEPVERGIYTGSIGYLGFNGCSALNIVIRTIVISNNRAHIQAGGGIIADSSDRGEYEESLLKAQKLFNAIGLAFKKDVYHEEHEGHEEKR